ncbi:MAG: RNA-directed DNA polymerase [Saprospiraceae bacterium]|nr:RNA-directed DNA polymerase [Candidatus Vicinibacter affinis]
MIKSKKHLSVLLKTKWEKLVEITENIDRYYFENKVIKKDKDGIPKLDKFGNPKIRTIYPSVGELKHLQKLINLKIFRLVPIFECAMGGVKKRDNIINSSFHKGKKYKFLTDLKDCFPSINSDMVYKSLINNGFSADIASILTKLTTYKNQIPQGARTSTYLCNIVMKKLDKQLLDLCHPYDITYTRFIDDLTFSSQSDFKKSAIQIIKIIESEDYKISHRKTGYMIGSTMITGNRVNNNSQTISDQLKSKIATPHSFTENQIKGHYQYAKRVMGEEKFKKLMGE